MQLFLVSQVRLSSELELKEIVMGNRIIPYWGGEKKGMQIFIVYLFHYHKNVLPP